MGRYYDNWERLFEAVIRREQLRSLSLADSGSTSTRSTDSDFSCSSWHDSLYSGTVPSPQEKDLVKLNLSRSGKEGQQSGRQKVPAKRRNPILMAQSILSGFSLRKMAERKEPQRAKLEADKTAELCSNQNSENVSLTTEMTKIRAESERMRELHTLKGHIQSLAKAKGVNLDSLHHYYTI